MPLSKTMLLQLSPPQDWNASLASLVLVAALRGRRHCGSETQLQTLGCHFTSSYVAVHE